MDWFCSAMVGPSIRNAFVGSNSSSDPWQSPQPALLVGGAGFPEWAMIPPGKAFATGVLAPINTDTSRSRWNPRVISFSNSALFRFPRSVGSTTARRALPARALGAATTRAAVTAQARGFEVELDNGAHPDRRTIGREPSSTFQNAEDSPTAQTLAGFAFDTDALGARTGEVAAGRRDLWLLATYQETVFIEARLARASGGRSAARCSSLWGRWAPMRRRSGARARATLAAARGRRSRMGRPLAAPAP